MGGRLGLEKMFLGFRWLGADLGFRAAGLEKGFFIFLETFLWIFLRKFYNVLLFLCTITV